MIYGIGSDVVHIPRIARIVRGKRAQKFVHKLLNEHERTAMPSAVFPFTTDALDAHIAGRWALKEAIAKMLGCGIGTTVSFHDITIVRSDRGRPIALMSPLAWDRLGIATPLRIHVTLTHDAHIAYAVAIGEYPDTDSTDARKR
jgi:holo-[acyl-carrier protein] synthase